MIVSAKETDQCLLPKELLSQIENKCLLDIVPHPNQKKYPHQRMFVINIDEYAFLVPFVETDDTIF